jgi:hypothetical protein
MLYTEASLWDQAEISVMQYLQRPKIQLTSLGIKYKQ